MSYAERAIALPQTKASDLLRDSLVFLATIVLTLAMGWSAKDLIWCAWITAVVSSVVLLSLPAVFMLVPGIDRIMGRKIRGSERSFIARVIGSLVLTGFLTLPIVAFIVYIVTILQPLAPEHVRMFHGGAYVQAAFLYALATFWPMALLWTGHELWNCLADIRKRPSQRILIGPLTEFFRLLALSVFLVILHHLGLGTAAVIPALLILFVPAKWILRFLAGDSVD